MVVLPVPKAGKGQEDPHTHQDDVANRTHDCFSPIQRASTLADNPPTAFADYVFYCCRFLFLFTLLTGLTKFLPMEPDPLCTDFPPLSNTSLRGKESCVDLWISSGFSWVSSGETELWFRDFRQTCVRAVLH